ncbi:hypothetical protein K1F50_14075 [Muricauda oceani]|uniref:Uncharacterized protein n=1 Tax=Flagellimonas oceani TaxID=2698672 RepID=A0A6G7J219_9FLAO|nr:hypothetical protein [Allomuricauda oceani]MBW8243931.1 hypothetical protein [Allomuricauda oceani]QII44913.1 hypothetical protein GVT53_09535 [Allomuricauda oceani]
MKATGQYICLFLSMIFLMSCGQDQYVFKTNRQDYDYFLTSGPLGVKPVGLQFEARTDSPQLPTLWNLANENIQVFKETGDIKFLKNAEETLKKAVSVATVEKSAYLRALARNYMLQHRFKEALALAEDARDLDTDVRATQSLLFDLHMELGNYHLANKYLDSIKDESSYEYVVRLAKWADHKGNLGTAIQLMEDATAKAKISQNEDLILSSYTNLANYYGEAGRIEEAYDLYLKALKIDSNNVNAKRGIAWIVYSYERNGKEALRILDSITQKNKSPEHYLFKAEVAAFINDDMLRVQALDDYYKMVGRNTDYGDMYNAHNVDFLLSMDVEQRAYKLAQEEVSIRPTPDSYAWLAYSLLHLGEEQKAMEVIDRHVINATFEPAILQRAAEIYKANGKEGKVRELKKKLMGATFELGPIKEAEVASL